MRVTLIAALDEDDVIGRSEGGLPWHLPSEVAHFRRYCQGKWLLLGRRTFDEMHGWFTDHVPLVLTHRPATLALPGRPVTAIDEALRRAAEGGATELVVLGGAEVFALTLPVADRLLLSRVHTHSGGDVRFPPFSRRSWQRVEAVHHPADPENPLPYTVEVFERRLG